MVRRKAAMWRVSIVAVLALAAGVAVFGFDIALRDAGGQPVAQVATTPPLDACQYLTNDEAGALLGQKLTREPVNIDNSAFTGMEDIGVASCEYNQGVPDRMIVTVAKGLTPAAIEKWHDIAGRPVDLASEELYTILDRSALISRERVGKEGEQEFASARILTKDGSVQVNAASFEIVEGAMPIILPRVDGGGDAP